MLSSKTYAQSRNVIKFLKYNAYFTQCNVLKPQKSHILAFSDCKVENRFSGVLKKFHKGALVYSTNPSQIESVDNVTFEKTCEETLESLTEYFEEIVEDAKNLEAADVSYSSGVLTVNLGAKYGTYVINRQSPNKQIWLSSPKSGPKRYDFIVGDNCWIYKHDGRSLHQLLQEEIGNIADFKVDFSQCAYSKL